MFSLDMVQKIVDRLADEFGLFGLGVDVLKDDDLENQMNACADFEAFEIHFTQPLLDKLFHRGVLFIIAHECSHITCCHQNNNGNSHLREFEADETAFDMLEFLGVPRSTIPNLVKKVSDTFEQEDNSEYLEFESYTHPSFKQRIESIKQRIKEGEL